MRDSALNAGSSMAAVAFLLAVLPYLIAHAVLRDGPDWALLVLMVIPVWALLCAGVGVAVALFVLTVATRLRKERVLASLLLALNVATLATLILREIV